MCRAEHPCRLCLRPTGGIEASARRPRASLPVYAARGLYRRFIGLPAAVLLGNLPSEIRYCQVVGVMATNLGATLR
jgi:hypothetical protein